MAPRGPLRILLILILSAVTPNLWALDLPEQERLHLTTQLEYLEDPAGELSLLDATRHSGWQANDDETFNRGYNDSVWWLRFSVGNTRDFVRNRLLSISYPVLNDVRVFIGGDGNQWDQLQLGFDYPFAQRPLAHRFFVIPLSWQPHESLQVYLRIETDSSVQVPLDLWQSHAFSGYSSQQNLIHGIYIGALLAIAVFNLLLYVALRDINYLFYVATIGSMALLILSIYGYTFRYLWPNAVDWNSQSLIIFFASSVGFASVFTWRFLELGAVSRRLCVLLASLIAVSLVLVPLTFLLPYSLAIRFVIPFAVFACCAVLAAGVVAWLRGQETARFYLLAWSFLLVGLVILALSKAGVLPSNAFTDSAAQVGLLLEAILLSFALAQRINVERRLRYAAQEEMLAASRRHNQELEARVHERTAALEKVNEKLSQLSTTDGLTGLRNRRFLDEAIDNELLRASRSGRPLTVALLDIDHFKKLNDSYGHQAGDECLKALGRLLDGSVRTPSDIAARFGGEEFVLILGETDSDAGYQVVERLRQAVSRLQVRYREQPLAFTVSIGLTTTDPGAPASAEELLRQADQALYRAKAAGRNRVCQSQPGGTRPSRNDLP